MSNQKNLCSSSCKELTCSSSGKIVYQKTTTTTITRFGQENPTQEEVNDALLTYNLNQENLEAALPNTASITPSAPKSFQSVSPKNVKNQPDNLQQPSDTNEKGKNDDGIQIVTDYENSKIDGHEKQEERSKDDSEARETNLENQEDVKDTSSEDDKNLKERIHLSVEDLNDEEDDGFEIKSKLKRLSTNQLNVEDDKKNPRMKKPSTELLRVEDNKISSTPFENAESIVIPNVSPITNDESRRIKCNVDTCPTFTKSQVKGSDTAEKPDTKESEALKKLKEYIENMTTEEIIQLTNTLEAQLLRDVPKTKQPAKKTSNQRMTAKQIENYTKYMEKEMNAIVRDLEQPPVYSKAKPSTNRSIGTSLVSHAYARPPDISNYQSTTASYPIQNDTSSQGYNNLPRYYEQSPKTSQTNYGNNYSYPDKFQTTGYNQVCPCNETPYTTKSMPTFSRPKTYKDETVHLSPSGNTLIKRVRTTTIITSSRND